MAVIGLAKYKGAIAALELQDITYSEEGSPVEPLDEDGNVEAIGVYGKKVSLQANGNVKAADTDMSALTIGATLTVDSIAYTITSIQIKESVTGAKTCSLSASAPKPAPPAG